MKPHRLVMRVSSAALIVDGVNAVSVIRLGVPPTAVACEVVAHAAMPGTALFTPAAVPALHTGIPKPPPVLMISCDVAYSLIITEFGIAGVSVLLIRSFFTDSDTNPFGVTMQVQHEISCSSGENVYTFTQMFAPSALVL